jgi:NAD(P)H-hydrate epimerase
METVLRPIDAYYVRSALPARREDGHKGTFGKLLIVGGSVGCTGAPYLAAEGAVRSGCGLVYLGVPESIWAVEAVKCASAMPFSLPDAGGKLCAEAYDAIHARLSACDVLALGPGLGRSAELDTLVRRLLRECPLPLVLDADGLNAIAEDLSALDAREGRVTILTPHDGEFARLSGYTMEELSGERRAEIAREFAVRHGCVLVLKGHRTIVALPDGTLRVNTTGGSALSKGGSGDVLTGVIAALLCQGAGAAEAARCGVWLHGRAGDALTEEMSAYCVSPQDVATQGLAKAFLEVTG